MSRFNPTSAKETERDVFGKVAVASNISINNVPSVINSSAMVKMDPQGLAEIRKLRDQLIHVNPTALTTYGDNVQDEVAKLADDMMAQTKSSDLEFIGSKLTDIIVQAKNINTQGISAKSKMPVIGGLINKFRLTKERVIGQFDSTAVQVEKIVTEVDAFTQKITTRLHTMGQLFDANQRQYYELDKLVLGARMALESLQRETDAFRASLGANPDPYDVQQLADAQNYMTSLEMKASNLEKIRHQALLAGPAIRIMQQNGINLIEQFKLVKTQVVPSWKRNFMLAIMLDEQERGVQLTNQISDASNQMAMQTASMLKQTSVNVAKANQRGVLDMQALEHVQSEMISSVTQVIEITQEGAKQRQAASQRISEMQNELQIALTQRN